KIANPKSKIKSHLAPLPSLPLVACRPAALRPLSSAFSATIQNTSGSAYATNALFAPLSTPLASGNNLIASTSTNVVAAANGSFSVLLKQGNYLVTIGGLRRDSVLISVPNDANTYNLNSLITNGITFTFPYS